MIFEDYYKLSELNFWKIETDIAWSQLDFDAAKKQPEINKQLREACFIESYHPLGTGKLMNLLANDVDATSILSIELFEGFRHFYVLQRYLEAIGSELAVTQEEVEKKRKHLTSQTTTGKPDIIHELFTFTFSEHFAAYYFVRIAEKTKEPVLKQIAQYIAHDEFRHAQAAYGILGRYIASKKDRLALLEETYQFKHYGLDIVDEVPVFQRNDIQAISSFVKKVEQLTKMRLLDYIKKHKLKKK